MTWSTGCLARECRRCRGCILRARDNHHRRSRRAKQEILRVLNQPGQGDMADSTASSAASAAPSPLDWRPMGNPWLIATAVMAATFMEVLDTTVVNVSLPHIAGTL